MGSMAQSSPASAGPNSFNARADLTVGDRTYEIYWINALAAKKLQKVAAVALANKLARICWAILSTGECFREETYAKV